MVFSLVGVRATKSQNNISQKTTLDRPQADIPWALLSRNPFSLLGTSKRKNFPRFGYPGSINLPHASSSIQDPIKHHLSSSTISLPLPSPPDTNIKPLTPASTSYSATVVNNQSHRNLIPSLLCPATMYFV
ncbi:unnamed protein product [Heterobilharzia americana]|nr:unnamed protein product [Heterobilharzia americana]